MPRDAYFSFGEEEFDAPLAVAGPESAQDSSDDPGFGGAVLGGSPHAPERSHRPTGRLRASLTPARVATLIGLILSMVLLGHALAGALSPGSSATHGITGRTGARVLAPAHPGISARAEDRPSRQKAEQGRAQRRRSQTRRRARRHRDRRPIERRDISARRVRPPAGKSSPEPAEEEAPPATQPTEVSAAQAPPSYMPPPEAAAEPTPEAAPPGPPHIRDGAHSQEFGL